MRRLLVLVCAVIFVDAMLYAALVPLLPRFVEDYELSKTGAGVLVGAYAAGALVGGFPGGLAAARFGPRRTVCVGLVLMAAAGVAFAFAGDAWTLGLARLLQGFGSALTWAGGLAWLVVAARGERRGELLGTAFGAAVFGALLGPVLGAAAHAAGREWVFSAVAGATLLMLVWALATAPAPAQALQPGATRRALAEPRFVGGLWLMTLPALLFGVIAVLVPLELDALGFGGVAIGAVFLVAAALEAIQAPIIGRFSDRRGRLLPVRLALAAAVAVSAAIAFADSALTVVPLVVAAAMAYSALFAPGMALLSEGAERTGLVQGLAFGFMNAAWAIGNMTGPAAAGALADAVGDELPFLIAGALCLATLIAAIRPRPVPAPLTGAPR